MTWSTNLISDSQVEYWSTGVHLKTPLDTGLVLNHSVHITGLTPGTLYHYIITSHDAAGKVATLTLEVTQGAKSSHAAIYWIIGILLLILLIILIIWLLTRRRRNKYMPPPSPRPTPPAPKPAATAPTAPVSPLAVVPPFVPPVVKPVEKKEVLLVPPVVENVVPPPPPFVPPAAPAQYNEITVKLTRGDFTLTPAAVEKLFSSSHSAPGQEHRVLRITRLPGTPVQLRMFVDKQGPDDISVTYNGAKILFLSPEATEMLGGIEIDFQTTGNGGEFALAKKKPA
jgi:Fe-S cluster assembly iron-binding protein IscA